MYFIQYKSQCEVLIQRVTVCNCDPFYPDGDSLQLRSYISRWSQFATAIQYQSLRLSIDNFNNSNFLLSQLYRNIELQIHNVLYRF